jgi:predicted transcriptional regulator
MPTLTIPLDPATSAALDEIAAAAARPKADIAAEALADYVRHAALPPLTIGDEDLRVSIEEQRREIAAGTAMLYPHKEVMAGARAKLMKALEAKS